MNRRHFVRGHTVALAGLAVRGAWQTRPKIGTKRCAAQASTTLSPGAIPPQDPASITLRDPRLAQLAWHALDAARAAGAQYADVRMTNTVERGVSADATKDLPFQRTTLGLSVRALVNGYWGWAATPMFSTDEGVRVGRLAATLASIGATHGRPRPIDLGTVPVVHTGDWATPMKIDPFTLDLLDFHDWLAGMSAHITDLIGARRGARSIAWEDAAYQVVGGAAAFKFGCRKQERLFASTEGSILTQTISTMSTDMRVEYRGVPILPRFDYAVQAGWEWVAETPILTLLEEAMDRVDAHPPVKLPTKPVEIGRYDMVFSALAMAQVLNGTLANATQLDRTLGYEANAGGTSYLGPDPFTWLGAPVASPLISLTAERSSPTGLATVKWDDEGVAPDDFPIIKDGVLVDYQTTREHAPWLAPWYQKQGTPVRSHGCAAAPDALSVAMQHTPNLVLHPGTEAADLDTLVHDLEHGILVEGQIGAFKTDWQCLDCYSGEVSVIEIRHGKRVARLDGSAGLLFRSDQFWKDIEALGGPNSVEQISAWPWASSGKGDPAQGTDYTMHMVPARIKQLALIDPTRKAS